MKYGTVERTAKVAKSIRNTTRPPKVGKAAKPYKVKSLKPSKKAKG